MSPQELDTIRNSLATATDEIVIATWKAVSQGGVHTMDPELVRIFAEEISSRGLSTDALRENRKRKQMKLTESQLRKRIRKAILEAKPHKNPRHHLQTHPGIGIAHADTTGVNCDFSASASSTLQDTLWKKLGNLAWVGRWSMPDGGDGYRFINTILQCRCKETGMIIMAVYCVDRANSENATRTSYDCYVLDCELIQDNHVNRNGDVVEDDLYWGSREWAKKGEYCTNTDQIVDTLKDAYDLYKELLDSGQI